MTLKNDLSDGWYLNQTKKMAMRVLGDLKRQVKDLRYDEVEIMVRNATSNNPMGATPEQLENIKDAMTATQHYHRMYSVLWKRCNDIEHKIHMVLLDVLQFNES